MIYDASGRPLRRAIGFTGGFVPEPPARAARLVLEPAVGFTVPLEDDEDNEE